MSKENVDVNKLVEENGKSIAISYKEGIEELKRRGVDVATEDFLISQKLKGDHGIEISSVTLHENGEKRRELRLRYVFNAPMTEKDLMNNHVFLDPADYDLEGYYIFLMDQEPVITDENGDTFKVSRLTEYTETVDVLDQEQ